MRPKSAQVPIALTPPANRSQLARPAPAARAGRRPTRRVGYGAGCVVVPPGVVVAPGVVDAPPGCCTGLMLEKSPRSTLLLLWPAFLSNSSREMSIAFNLPTPAASGG